MKPHNDSDESHGVVMKEEGASTILLRERVSPGSLDGS